MNRLTGIVSLAGALALVIWLQGCGGSSGSTSVRSVTATRGTVVRNATAVGRIEAEQEVPVKSLTGGIITKLYVRLGQRVEKGDQLAEVKPILTERTLLGAERAVELARDGEEAAKEYLEGKHIAGQLTRMFMGGKNLERMVRGAEYGRKQAEEQLELLRKGEVKVDDRRVDFIVRAPAGGHVIAIRQREGTPVVPASSYGSGTVFMALADMNRPVFRGTVDEIDVGRLKEGMPVTITIGALPGMTLTGTLVEIALKGRLSNNAVVFDVRIAVESPEDVTLRSGYSAVATIEVDRRENVLVLPERVVDFRGEKAFVQVAGAQKELEIDVGLSDGLTVEVVAGLSEGQEVLERVYD